MSSSLTRVVLQESQAPRNLDFLGLPNTEGRAVVQPLYGQPQQQSLDSQLIQQILDTGIRLGKIFNAVESQKEVLETGNHVLEEDMKQIKKRHLQELNALVDSWEAKATFIFQKLTIVIGRLNKYSAEPKLNCGAYPLDANPLQRLVNSIPRFNARTLRTYPEYSNTLPNKAALLHEDPATSPALEKLIDQTHPLILSFIQDRIQEMQSLTQEVNSLRGSQASLNAKKKSMIDFHVSFIKEQNNKMQGQLDIRQIYNKAHSIIQNIRWNIPLTSVNACQNCLFGRSSPLDDITRETYHNRLQVRNNQKLKELREEVKDIMSSIKKEI